VPTSAAALNVGAGDFAVEIAPDRDALRLRNIHFVADVYWRDAGTTFTIGARIKRERLRFVLHPTGKEGVFFIFAQMRDESQLRGCATGVVSRPWFYSRGANDSRQICEAAETSLQARCSVCSAALQHSQVRF
jgi:hypothetical protein